MKLLLAVVAASLCSTTLATPVPLARRDNATTYNVTAWTSETLPPRQDPWYSAPDGWESASPGAILRIRYAPGDLTSLAGSGCQATYNILYRTTNSRDAATWAVTTLFVPTSISPALLSYQTPYDSVDLDASPSYGVYSDVGDDVIASLDKGWFVSVPDYEGPLASFTAGVLSGRATLDSIRAVLNGASVYDLPSDTVYALWGYSGGALASEWATELQADYAPELNISGAALGGLTPNVVNVFETINGGLAAGLIPAGIIGIANQWPDLLADLYASLNPTGLFNSAGFLATLNMTSTEAIENYILHDIYDYFINGSSDVFNSDTYPIIDSDGIMGTHGTPQYPLYVYKAVLDEVSPISDTDDLVDKFCAAGANILYQRNWIGGHEAEGVNGRPAAEDFLASLFNGTYSSLYTTSGCTIENVLVALNILPIRAEEAE